MPTELTMKVTIKTQRKHGPDGDFNDLAARLVSRAPIISYRTAQALKTYLEATAPQPPRQAWWYASPPNPRTKKVVPPNEQYVRTGDLSRSIVGPLGFGPSGAREYYVVVNNEYAKFVENGTRYMPPQPFFRDGVRYVRKHVMPGLVKNWLRKGRL